MIELKVTVEFMNPEEMNAALVRQAADTLSEMDADTSADLESEDTQHESAEGTTIRSTKGEAE